MSPVDEAKPIVSGSSHSRNMIASSTCRQVICSRANMSHPTPPPWQRKYESTANDRGLYLAVHGFERDDARPARDAHATGNAPHADTRPQRSAGRGTRQTQRCWAGCPNPGPCPTSQSVVASGHDAAPFRLQNLNVRTILDFVAFGIALAVTLAVNCSASLGVASGIGHLHANHAAFRESGNFAPQRSSTLTCGRDSRGGQFSACNTTSCSSATSPGAGICMMGITLGQFSCSTGLDCIAIGYQIVHRHVSAQNWHRRLTSADVVRNSAGQPPELVTAHAWVSVVVS